MSLASVVILNWLQFEYSLTKVADQANLLGQQINQLQRELSLKRFLTARQRNFFAKLIRIQVFESSFIFLYLQKYLVLCLEFRTKFEFLTVRASVLANRLFQFLNSCDARCLSF